MAGAARRSMRNQALQSCFRESSALQAPCSLDVTLACGPQSPRSGFQYIFEAGYHVKAMRLFGSVVHGEERPKRDIDVLVEFQSPIGLFKFLELEELLAERLGAKVDLVSKKVLKPEIGRAILSEVVRV